MFVLLSNVPVEPGMIPCSSRQFPPGHSVPPRLLGDCSVGGIATSTVPFRRRHRSHKDADWSICGLERASCKPDGHAARTWFCRRHLRSLVRLGLRFSDSWPVGRTASRCWGFTRSRDARSLSSSALFGRPAGAEESVPPTPKGS